MTLTRVCLTDFRNIESAEIDFDPGVNVLWGDNAQGKSNVLEAIYFSARGKSFRGAAEKQLIRYGQPFASVGVEYKKEDAERTNTLEFTLPEAGRKQMYRDGVQETHLADMVSRLKAVLFTPQHLSLVSGGPLERRAFTDIAIATAYPAYIGAMTAFKKTLEQRNALLRETAISGRRPDYEVFEVFAEHLAGVSSVVASCRADYIKRLDVLAREQVLSLSGGRDVLSLRYMPSGCTPTAIQKDISDPVLGTGGMPDGAYAEAMKTLLMTNLDAELSAKTTLHGPHRDDVEILLGSMPARHFASQGQTRSIALSMKIAEGQLTHSMLKEKPIYLLDDVLSELDESRRRYLLTKLRDDQMILTSCEPDFRVQNLTGYENVRRLCVENGRIVGENPRF